MTLLISAYRVARRIVSKWTNVHTKNGSREQNHALFRGDLSSIRPNLIYSPYVQSLRALASAIPEIWMGHPKFTRGSAMAEGLRDELVSRNSATTKHPIWKLECDIICVILRLAIFVQYRSVTDTHRQTDGRTDTQRRHVLRVAQRRAVKIDHIALLTKNNCQARSVGW